MTNQQILFKKVISANGRSVAEATSVGNKDSKIIQSVTVKTTSSSHSASSSSTSSTSVSS